jgi:hypothetical protein
VTFQIVWILAMAVIGVFAYRRGWDQTPYWLRQYVWCAVVLEAIVWLPFITLPFIRADFSNSQTVDFFLFLYAVVIFLDTILVWAGIAIGAVLLVVMLTPAKT